MRKEQKFISVVAYVYNDEKLIRAFLEYTMEKCRESFEKCELILVDDNSSDRSFMGQHLASGWVSFMGFLSLGFIGIFGIMTIVLRYLGVLINLTYKQQHHMIEDIGKISGN